MAYEQREGDIVLYLTKEKKTDRSPDYWGKALIDGVQKDVAVWIKTDTMMAGTIKNKYIPDFEAAKDAVSSHNQAKANGFAPADDFDDEIPF